jgi:hypothetical protein
MLQRQIPKTTEQLPVVGIGTWQTFDVGNTRPELDPRKEVLDILCTAGGRVIDTSAPNPSSRPRQTPHPPRPRRLPLQRQSQARA